jgi:hypothetical protein
MPSTMATNLTSSWVYDNDVFAVNQFAHPYGGAALFLTARSSGLGFWTSAAYGFGGSLLWETLMENEPSSINDQLTTSIAGAFLGEALHRWSRAVLSSDAHPSIGRRLLSGVVDPIGTKLGLRIDRAKALFAPSTPASSCTRDRRRMREGPGAGPLDLRSKTFAATACMVARAGGSALAPAWAGAVEPPSTPPTSRLKERNVNAGEAVCARTV